MRRTISIISLAAGRIGFAGAAHANPTTCDEADGIVGCWLGDQNFFCASGSDMVSEETCSGAKVCGSKREQGLVRLRRCAGDGQSERQLSALVQRRRQRRRERFVEQRRVEHGRELHREQQRRVEQQQRREQQRVELEQRLVGRGRRRRGVRRRRRLRDIVRRRARRCRLGRRARARRPRREASTPRLIRRGRGAPVAGGSTSIALLRSMLRAVESRRRRSARERGLRANGSRRPCCCSSVSGCTSPAEVDRRARRMLRRTSRRRRARRLRRAPRRARPPRQSTPRRPKPRARARATRRRRRAPPSSHAFERQRRRAPPRSPGEEGRGIDEGSCEGRAHGGADRERGADRRGRANLSGARRSIHEPRRTTVSPPPRHLHARRADRLLGSRRRGARDLPQDAAARATTPSRSSPSTKATAAACSRISTATNSPSAAARPSRARPTRRRRSPSRRPRGAAWSRASRTASR